LHSAFLHVALFKYVDRLENGRALIQQIMDMVGDELNPRGNIYKNFTDEETLQLVRAAATVSGKGERERGGRRSDLWRKRCGEG
jgi:hypothetical protein